MLSLIGMMVIVVIVAVFAGFNMNTRCDINLIYKTFEQVPVFLALIFAFVAGVVVAMPFVFVGRHKHNAKEPKPRKPPKEPKKKKEKDVPAAVEPVVETPAAEADVPPISPEAAAKLEEIDNNSPRMQ